MTTRLEGSTGWPVIVNVNRGKVDGNRKHCTLEPVISARRGKHGKAVYGTTVRIVGDVTFRYDPNHPLPCGARVWAECYGTVDVS